MRRYITLENIEFKYSKTDFRINNITLFFNDTQTSVITGSNGSGKTTLAKIIMGILKADSGNIFIQENNAASMSLPDRAGQIGFCFQNPEKQFFSLSVIEELAFSLRQRGCGSDDALSNAQELLARFSMQNKADEFHRNLSGGEKKVLSLLSMLSLDLPYYIMDEPAAGLDTHCRKEINIMLSALKNKGTGLCIITHEKDSFKFLADRFITMKNGSILNDENT